MTACHYQPASRCHPERSEGSAVRVRDVAGRRRSFAALRMTGERVVVMAYHDNDPLACNAIQISSMVRTILWILALPYVLRFSLFEWHCPLACHPECREGSVGRARHWSRLQILRGAQDDIWRQVYNDITMD